MSSEVREAVLQRDGYRCQAHAWEFALDLPCSNSGELHVHHRRLRAQGGTDDPENLLTLCDGHHLHAHDVDRRGAEMTGIILRY